MQLSLAGQREAVPPSHTGALATSDIAGSTFPKSRDCAMPQSQERPYVLFLHPEVKG